MSFTTATGPGGGGGIRGSIQGVPRPDVQLPGCQGGAMSPAAVPHHFPCPAGLSQHVDTVWVQLHNYESR